MGEAKSKLLIVEDDLDLADMLNAYFRVQGYEVFTVNWGEDGVRASQTVAPDLIILDIRLPDIDGYEVARRVRSARKTQTVPIIFLTEKRERADRLMGLEVGADDYITKPFDIQELRIRTRNALMRISQSNLTNPVTGLPEGRVVDEQLESCLTNQNWAILVISLNGLDEFRESYGFVASDDVLRAVSVMIQNAIHELGIVEGFLGHLEATDFLLILQGGNPAQFEDRIRTRLEQSLDYFYPIRDREQTLYSGKRLSINIHKLSSDNNSFGSLDELKENLTSNRNR